MVGDLVRNFFGYEISTQFEVNIIICQLFGLHFKAITKAIV